MTNDSTSAPYVHRKNYEQPQEYWDALFAKHQIIRQGERCLELRNPTDSNNWMTISIDRCTHIDTRTGRAIPFLNGPGVMPPQCPMLEGSVTYIAIRREKPK